MPNRSSLAASADRIAFRDFMAPDGALLSAPVYGPEANYELQKDGRGLLEWGPRRGPHIPGARPAPLRLSILAGAPADQRH